jgi:hypothetical protein
LVSARAMPSRCTLLPTVEEIGDLCGVTPCAASPPGRYAITRHALKSPQAATRPREAGCRSRPTRQGALFQGFSPVEREAPYPRIAFTPHPATAPQDTEARQPPERPGTYARSCGGGPAGPSGRAWRLSIVMAGPRTRYSALRGAIAGSIAAVPRRHGLSQLAHRPPALAIWERGRGAEGFEPILPVAAPVFPGFDAGPLPEQAVEGVQIADAAAKPDVATGGGAVTSAMPALPRDLLETVGPSTAGWKDRDALSARAREIRAHRPCRWVSSGARRHLCGQRWLAYRPVTGEPRWRVHFPLIGVRAAR